MLREIQSKSAAFSLFTSNLDLSPQPFGEFLGNRQSQSCAPILPGGGAIRLLKGFKNDLVFFCRNSDGYYGWKEFSPFDAIVVTAAAEYIPPPLIKQLKDGGKMIIPVGSPFLTQMLVLVEKNGDEIFTTSLLPVRFVPFTRGN